MAYRRAIDALRGIKEPITDMAQVKGIPGIGDGIKRKIKEFIDNGVFRHVQDPFPPEKMAGIKELMEISYVGQEKALTLYNDGFTSLEVLR